ncbi:hypothetical protein ASPVEDRAFT_24830 [Aspergillus versicolor CBS 583.65]|uniref:Granulins domain-containing protein n=1 Tax=Aspergillus versicolor CBS 583.65 TaxID=1036611 RepID=A0A1L9P8W2_ASPVE|nr:uncharacterized protein ASPVEDRAFT_24830 [Aspergillus versicolor CBS 583.65]OJI97913.1 hypothetical protein ASPVEDRAFT_24830 [Aspergillus versicolor CBS 583.65]
MISLLLLAPVLAGQTAASPDSALLLNRDTIPATTGCPDDWPLCGDSVCYNPIEGQTCCPGRTYACPSSTFCLFDPFCCPNDQTPEECARQNGLVLSSTALVPETPQQTQFPTESSDPGFSSSSDPLLPQPTTIVISSSASSITISSTPVPTSPTTPWPSWSATPGVEEQPAYTGAGSGLGRSGGDGLALGMVAAVVGAMGW